TRTLLQLLNLSLFLLELPVRCGVLELSLEAQHVSPVPLAKSRERLIRGNITFGRILNRGEFMLKIANSIACLIFRSLKFRFHLPKLPLCIRKCAELLLSNLKLLLV